MLLQRSILKMYCSLLWLLRSDDSDATNAEFVLGLSCFFVGAFVDLFVFAFMILVRFLGGFEYIMQI